MKPRLFMLCVILIVFTLLASSCASTNTEVVTNGSSATSVTEATQTIQNSSEDVPATELPSELTSLVGGKITQVLTGDPDTLDPQKTNLGASSYVMFQLYSSLIIKDRQGKYTPYLASSWEISPDGLTYTFHLKKNIKFHNGEPLTAKDVVWTYQRELDPATAAANTLESVETITALDDYTVQFTLTSPNYYFLDALTDDGYQGILNEKAVEQYGDNYGHNPVGTGPFIFKEWVTGDHITLDRNPDFTWGPSFTNGTPPNIQTIEFRIIPETATIVAGLETGELDYVAGGSGVLTSIDVNNLEATDLFDIVKTPIPGMAPFVVLNLEKTPFDDVRVRQALNYATNKQAIMDIVSPNSGAVVQNGPLSASQEGYWSGIEELGYSYDLEKAKQLMLDAGFTYNTDGMLEKDGQPLTFELILINNYESLMKPGEILQSQWKELGINVTLSVQDVGVALAAVSEGNYSASLFAWTMSTSHTLVDLFLSSNIGGSNYSRLNNPELDVYLNNMVNSIDYDEHMKAVQDAQVMILNQAYVVTMFSQVTGDVISKRVKNYSIDPYVGFRFWDAYIEE